METRTARPMGEVVALVAVVLTAALFLALSAGRITAPFGDSDEGINAAVWSTNARALRHLGPVDSHLGGRREDGTRYATHPPTIVVAIAVAQWVAGDHPWSSRAPAWIASIVALLLLYQLGRRAGFDPLAAGGAVVAVGLTPMMLAYGAMLDTPVICFPFGVAVVLRWYQVWQNDDPARPGWAPVGSMAATAGLGALAGLAGWQAAVVTALCGLSLAARALRHRPGAIRAALPFVVGGAIGVGLSLSWSWWVYGDFHTLASKFNGRSGTAGGVGLGDMLSFQVPWIANLLSLSIIGLVGCVAALWDKRVRPLAAMSLAAVVVYALIFRQAAAGHQYWNYWALLPAAVGWGHLLQRLLAEVRERAKPTSRTMASLVAVAVVVVGVAAFDTLRPNQAAGYIDDGRRAAELVARTTFPPDQVALNYVGQPYRPDAWIDYNTGRSPVALTSADELRALADARPDDLVLVLGSCDPTDPSFSFCASLLAPGVPHLALQSTPPRIVTAAELAGHLARSGN
jgi:hypothetical protein